MPPTLSSLASISRQTPLSTSTNGRTTLKAVYTNVPCFVMPMNHRTAIDLHFDIGRAASIHFALGQDVKPEDIVTVNGNTYVVGAVQSFNVPLVGHVVAHSEQEIS